MYLSHIAPDLWPSTLSWWNSIPHQLFTTLDLDLLLQLLSTSVELENQDAWTASTVPWSLVESGGPRFHPWWRNRCRKSSGSASTVLDSPDFCWIESTSGQAREVVAPIEPSMYRVRVGTEGQHHLTIKSRSDPTWRHSQHLKGFFSFLRNLQISAYHVPCLWQNRPSKNTVYSQECTGRKNNVVLATVAGNMAQHCWKLTFNNDRALDAKSAENIMPPAIYLQLDQPANGLRCHRTHSERPGCKWYKDQAERLRSTSATHYCWWM